LAGAGLLAMGGGLVLLGAILALFVVPGALQGALPWLMLRRLRHQEPLRLAALLKASDAGILAGVIYSLIFGVLTILVAQLGLIYGLFLTVPYSIGLYRMADGERSALRAFGAGLRVLRSHLLGHVAFAAIALVLQTMSYCTLGLALMITVPLQMLACALLYLAHEERGMFTVSESPEGAPPGPG
ncbi:MAG TPA: hypothetical protein VEI97_02555, partial [bacterium]|nr:hypothetical protein [bacterium]